MTERENIIEIIKRNGTYNGRSLSFDYYVIQPDDLADALIAAGIGDTTNLIVENEVLQRALRSLAQLCAKGAKYYLQSDEAIKERERELYNEWIKQAEKELAEEKNNEHEL